MWHKWSLQTRILLGYGLILALAAALALFLVMRIGSLNQDMQQLNSGAAVETNVGIRMTRDVAEVQQAVSRYFQQSQPAQLQAVHDSLRQLTTNIDQIEPTLDTSNRQALLNDLKHQTQIYHNTFESVSRLLKEQEPLRVGVNTHLARAISLLNNTLAIAQRDQRDSRLVGQLIGAQTSLQQANFWIIRLSNDPTQNLGMNAIAELNKARLILRRNLGEPGTATYVNIDSTLTEIVLATDLTNQLMRSIRQVQQQRDQALDEQGDALKQKADAIAQQAMNNLTSSAGSLAQHTRRTQEITGGALLAGLMLVLGLGFGLAQTITRPLKELVGATSRLAQGDYSVTVSQRDGSEIGQLATIFNQMTATLRQQHSEMLRQQAAIVSRNQELEQALAEIKTATDAQAALAATVRKLTVPVVPILDNVIVVSLVGEIDEQRAQTLLDRLLDGVTEQHATIAILDVTGVPFIDAHNVGWLLRVADAVKLLGARCLLVGIRPEVAQAMVVSGINLAGITTRATLQDAVEYALQATARKR
jgi:rsbT co-antagonist protein RsbR